MPGTERSLSGPNRIRGSAESRGDCGGTKYQLGLPDRLPVTHIHLGHGGSHDVFARWFRVSCSTGTRAVRELRPVPAEGGCATAPRVRLCTSAEATEHVSARRTGVV